MAEKKVIELEVKTDSFKPLKAQLREAQQLVAELSEKFGATSKEAIAAAKRASELKDAIADAKDLTDAFNPDAKFNALSNSIGGALNGFQAFEGALGLVGVESEQLQAALLKVQSAMALSQGLQGVLEAKDSFKQLGAVVGDAFKGMTNSSKAFALTGIGLLITAIGTLVANWDSVAQKIGLVNEKQDALNSTMDAYKEGAKDAIQQTTEVANSFELARQGVISKEEALFVYNETLGDSFGKAKNLNEAEKLYAQKTDAYIKATALRAQAQALFAKAADEQVKALTANMEDQTGVFDKAKAGIYAYFGGVKEGANELIKAQKEGEKQTKKTANARANQLNDLAASMLKEAELIEKKNHIVSENEKKTQDYIASKKKKTTEEIVKETRKQGEVTQEQEDFFTQMLVDSEAEKDKIRTDALEKQKEDELAAMQFRGDLYKQDVDNFDKSEAEKKKSREANKNFAIQTAEQTLSLISSISELYAKKGEKQAKRAFEIQKAAGIAQATIETYKAANGIFAAAALNPETVLFPAQPFIEAGLAVAFGLVNVAKIASQKFEGGGSPAGGGGGNTTVPNGGASTITPNFNIVGNAQATNPLAGLGSQPLQAYVVSGEVTTAQNLDRNRINYATFG